MNIKEQYDNIMLKLNLAKYQVNIILGELKALQKYCNHQNKFERSYYDGSSDFECPDCGANNI